jgi:hypothetical protein
MGLCWPATICNTHTRTCLRTPPLQVNKRLGDSENARRLPKIQERLVYDPSTRWVGAKELDLNLVGDPSRKLVHEGRLQYIRPQVRPSQTRVEHPLIPHH